MRRYSAMFIIAPPHTDRWPGTRRCRRATSTKRGSRFAAQTSREMADRPDQDAGEPELEAEAHGPGERAVEDRHRARRHTAEQDGFAQRPVEPGR